MNDEGECPSWFSETVEYGGSGTFVYKDPKGTFSGPTRIVAGPDGKLNLRMSTDCVDIGDLRNPGWHLFFNGTRLEDDEDKESWGFGGGTPNVCEKATVDCAPAVFDVTRPGVGTDTNDPEASPIDNLVQQSKLPKLSIAPLAGRYVTALNRPPKYWVLPLINFMGIDFRGPNSDLEDHPLRVNSGKGLCVFRYKGKPAFIEPVPEYKERVNALKEREIRSAITAVMVGEVVDCSDIWSDTALPQPTKLLTALGLVDGTRLGSPWMEYRDESGLLLARHHTRFTSREFSRKEDLIREYQIPSFLESAALNIHEVDGYFTYSVNTLLESFGALSILDLSFALVCTSLESLYNRAGIARVLLSSRLSEAALAQVDQELSQCANVIRQSARSSRNQGRIAEADTLQEISQRVMNAKNRSGQFGLKVEQLLDHNGFHDSSVISGGYQTRYLNTWNAQVSNYRAAGVHGELIQDWDVKHKEMFAILRHLQDITVRTLLGILKYKGEYCPLMSRGSGSENTDWVKPGLPPSALGYDF